VIAVDLAWNTLARASWWRGQLERRRNARVERLMASGGGFWITFVLAPTVGPWVVMAFLRYAQVPQRRVVAPILLALLTTATIVAIGCSWA
jgi:hypothetical protein